MIPRVWRSARSLFYGWDKGNGSKGAPPGYDIKRAHARLTVGVDRLWIAAMIRAKGRVWDDPEGMQHRFYGAVITSVSGPPPDRPRKLLLKKRSLTVHFVAAYGIEAWIDDAVEKITAYGVGNGCEQLFILGRKQWGEYAKLFYGRFESVAFARDRMTERGRDPHNRQQRPGAFRRIEPMPVDGKRTYDDLRHSRRRIYIRNPQDDERRSA
jgi:hypothetical protein